MLHINVMTPAMRSTLRVRRFHERNPEKALEYGRRWESNNRETVRAKHRRWAKANSETAHANSRKSAKAWRKANPDKAYAHSRAYLKAHPEKTRCYVHTYRTRKTGAGGSHTPEQFEALGNICLKCGYVGVMTVDHVLPVLLGGSSDISNIQPLCGPCNSSKGAKHIDYRRTVCKENECLLSAELAPSVLLSSSVTSQLTSQRYV